MPTGKCHIRSAKMASVEPNEECWVRRVSGSESRSGDTVLADNLCPLLDDGCEETITGMLARNRSHKPAADERVEAIPN